MPFLVRGGGTRDITFACDGGRNDVSKGFLVGSSEVGVGDDNAVAFVVPFDCNDASFGVLC